MMSVESGRETEAMKGEMRLVADRALDNFEKVWSATKAGSAESPEAKAKLQEILDAEIEVQGALRVAERLVASGQLESSAQKIVEDLRSIEGGEIDVEQIHKAIEEFEANQVAQS